MINFFICSLLCLLGLTTSLLSKETGLKRLNCPPSSLVPTAINSSAGLQSGIDTSTHWSGYVAADSFKDAEKGSVKAVAGSWVVPQLSGDPGSSLIWVGIDGFTTTAIERIGTSQSWNGAAQTNFAWFSVIPNVQIPLPFPVAAGDLMAAEVNYVGDGQFLMLIQNMTQGWFTFAPPTLTIAHGTRRDTAEWIVEAQGGCAPENVSSCSLADFGKVHFSHCYANIDGDTGFIHDDDWKHSRITMVSETNSNIIKAKPSELRRDGSSFHVTWKDAGP